MSVSDLLTVLTILLALAAFLSEYSRKYILMKFSWRSWSYFGLLFVIINFLLAFDWISDKCSLLDIFVFDKSLPSDFWAYIVTLLFLGSIIYKIFRGFYPKSKKEAVLQEYMNLVLKGEFALLVQLIENYHYKDIIKYLQTVQSISKEETVNSVLKTANGEVTNTKTEEVEVSIENAQISILDWQKKQQKYLQEYDKVINTNRLKYADGIYHRIILNETFLDFVAITNPYFFTPIISELSTRELKQEDFVNKFLQLLMKNKNYYFFNEIKSVKNNSVNDTWDIPETAMILLALFRNIDVAESNEAWRGIADEALLEMEKETKKSQSPLKEYENERNVDTLWTYRIKIAIHYFDIMVRQAINAGSDNSMWMHSYKYFINAILSNLKELPTLDSDINKFTRNFDLLQEVVGNLISWKKVVIQSGHNNLIKDIYFTTGGCIFSIALNENLRLEDKKDLIGWIISDLIKTKGLDDKSKEITAQLIKQGFKAIRNPLNFLQFENKERRLKYKTTIKSIWQDIDKLQFQSITAFKEGFDKFENEVIKNILED